MSCYLRNFEDVLSGSYIPHICLWWVLYNFLLFLSLVLMSIFVPCIFWLEIFFWWVLRLLSQLYFGPQLPDTSFFILLFFTFLCLFALKYLLSVACYWILFCFSNPGWMSVFLTVSFNMFTFIVIPTILRFTSAIFSHICWVWLYDHNLWGPSKNPNI